MTEQEYKEKLHTFRSSCRVYKQEKAFLENAEKENVPTDQKLIGFIKENVESVERTFKLIRELCGRQRHSWCGCCI